MKVKNVKELDGCKAQIELRVAKKTVDDCASRTKYEKRIGLNTCKSAGF